MSEPTPREELRQKIVDVCMETHSVNLPMVNKLEQLINTEVLAVLDQLEKQKQLLVLKSDGAKWGIRTSAIAQLKQRYGGKEQEYASS